MKNCLIALCPRYNVHVVKISAYLDIICRLQGEENIQKVWIKPLKYPLWKVWGLCDYYRRLNMLKFWITGRVATKSHSQIIKVTGPRGQSVSVGGHLFAKSQNTKFPRTSVLREVFSWNFHQTLLTAVSLDGPRLLGLAQRWGLLSI